MKGEITGIEELDKALTELGQSVTKRLLKKSLKDGCDPMLAVAQRVAPKDTGEMAESIHIEPMARSRKAFGFKIELGRGGTEYKGEQFYGAFQEYGHKVGSRKLGDHRRWVEGKHFLGYAFDTTQDESKKIILESLKANIEKEVKRLAKRAAKIQAKEGQQ